MSRLHRTGLGPHRVLLIGSEVLLAAGRRVPAEALGERIADRVWLRTRRGLDLDMLWELAPVLRAIREGLSSWRLWRYDAVVIVSAAQPGLLGRWRSRAVAQLLQRVLREVSTASHVLLVSLEPETTLVGAQGRQVDSEVVSVAGATSDPDGTPRVTALSTSLNVQTGADAIAVHLLAPLAAADEVAHDESLDAAHRRRREADDESGRQRAVDALGLQPQAVERRLQLVLEMAQATFDASSAEVTVIDHDRQWTLAAAGEKRYDLPREMSLCSRSIELREPTLISDTWRVPALRGNPLVDGPKPIRFYAAYPLESVDGYRFGVLCVWDSVPHPVDRFDVSALRDLALLAEGEIITAAG